MRIKPVDEVAVPEQAVLRFEHPVGFIREVKVAARDVSHLRGIVGCHALGSHNAEVEFTVDDADGCIPFIYKQMG